MGCVQKAVQPTGPSSRLPSVPLIWSGCARRLESHSEGRGPKGETTWLNVGRRRESERKALSRDEDHVKFVLRRRATPVRIVFEIGLFCSELGLHIVFSIAWWLCLVQKLSVASRPVGEEDTFGEGRRHMRTVGCLKLGLSCPDSERQLFFSGT